MENLRLGIEERIELLEFVQTQSYFREAYNCYINGNYRAAVVSLWSVMVCEAVYKTKKLASVYEDKWAIKKTQAIENLQKSNITTSEWELDLFESLYAEKKFIVIADITNIRDLQKKRHFCAHPVLTEDSSLLSPNKESVKSMLINALDGFLLKQSYYNKEVGSLIIETLADKSEHYIKQENTEKLISEYTRRMTDHALFEIYQSF